MKYFEIKLYSQKWEFKKQINTTSDINFSEQLDWWQSNLNLEVIWNSVDFNCSDIIEIREVNIWVKLQLNYWDDSQIWDDSKIWDDWEKPVISTYTWIIEKIWVTEYKNKEVLNKQLIIEGVLSIQAGDNPKVLGEKLKSFLAPEDRVKVGGKEEER